jgi:hypothetical protein
MSKVTLRRLLSRLTALALSTSAMGVTAASPGAPSSMPSEVSDDDADLAADLEIDREHIDDYDAALALGRSLALAFGELRPLSATHLAATWSLSDDPVRRLAIAFALEWTFPLVGDALIIDHLSRDADPAIRTAAVRAAWTRRPTGGDLGVIARLMGDPDPQVRAVAAAAAT